MDDRKETAAEGIVQWLPSTFGEHAEGDGSDPIPVDEQLAAAFRYMAGKYMIGESGESGV